MSISTAMEGSGFVLIFLIFDSKTLPTCALWYFCFRSIYFPAHLVFYILTDCKFTEVWLSCYRIHRYYMYTICIFCSMSWSLCKAKISVCIRWVETKVLIQQEYHASYLAVTLKFSNRSHLCKWLKPTLVKRLSSSILRCQSSPGNYYS